MTLQARLLVGTTALFALSATATASLAQAAPSAAQADKAATIETLVVTARRVSENVQKIPVAVTAVSTRDLRDRNIKQLNDLVAATPGLTVTQAQSDPSAASFIIRGQGAPDTTITTDSPVGVYVDGVYMPRATGLQYILRDTSEIGQVEVLRGPQGTLYGRNTTGGAFNITSQAPTQDYSAYADLNVGNYNLVDIAVGANLPLGDNMGLRLAYDHGQHDGYGTDGVGAPLENENYNFFHGRFTANPTDRLSFDASANYLDLTEGEAIVKFLGFDTYSLSPGAGAANQQAAGGVLADVLALSGYGYPAFLNPANFPTAIGILDSYAGGSIYHTGSNDDATPEKEKMFDGSFTGAYKLDDHLTVKSITGYVYSKRSNDLELDGTPFGLLNVPYYTYSNFFSEELQLLFKYGNFDGVAGGYFSHEHGEEDSFAEDLPALGALPFVYDGIATNESEAGFIQGNWHATDKLTFTAGVRYTSESKELVSLNHDGGPNTPGYVLPLPAAPGTSCSIDPTLLVNPALCEANLKNSYSAATWLASVDYQFTPDAMVYAKASRGYRGGGENIRGTNELTFQPFAPEFVIQYEGGFKTTFLDGRARVNAAGYYTDYSNIQVSTLLNNGTASFTTIQNAAKARVYGFEFEGTLVPVKNLTLSLIANYNNLKYLKYQDLEENLTPTPQTNPKDTVDIMGRYVVPLSVGSLSLQADYYWQDKYYTGVGDPYTPGSSTAPYTFNNAFDLYIPSRGLLNARVTLHLAKWQTDISLWGSNIANKAYFQSELQPFGPVFTIGYAGQPRTFGIEIRKSFGGR